MAAIESILEVAPRDVGLVLSTFALPGGFFLGGLFVIPPDPGLGIVLVPVGGLLLFAGIALVAREV